MESQEFCLTIPFFLLDGLRRPESVPVNGSVSFLADRVAVSSVPGWIPFRIFFSVSFDFSVFL